VSSRGKHTKMTLRTVKQDNQFRKALALGRKLQRQRQPKAPPLDKASARKLCAQACATHPITRINTGEPCGQSSSASPSDTSSDTSSATSEAPRDMDEKNQ
jgi:hypothetical protein